MPDDSELLRRYVNGSEAAFTEFVQRHLGLVYAAALRRVGNDRMLAEEITQTVFIQCARKAQLLVAHPTLGGWLHRSTRFAAIDARRSQQSRLAAEQNRLMPNDATVEPREIWEDVRPEIDALIDRLGERDRDAVVLRFFEGHSFGEIAAKLRVSEDAARMRVDRALDKLRVALSRRGFTSTAAALGAALGQHGAFAAPPALVASVSAAAMTVVPAGSVGALTGLAALFMNKVSIGAIVTVVAVGLVAVVGESKANLALDRRLADAKRATVSAPNVAAGNDSPAVDRTSELARLRARLAELKARPDGVVDSAIIKVVDLRNVGRATPEAAFETVAWAVFNHDLDVVADGLYLGKTKPVADRYFANLPPELRARYQTPERLYAPYIISGPPGKTKFDAIQVIELIPGDRPDEVQARVWFHRPDGTTVVGLQPFTQIGDEWKMGNRAMGYSFGHAVKWLQEHEGPGFPDLPGNEP